MNLQSPFESSRIESRQGQRINNTLKRCEKILLSSFHHPITLWYHIFKQASYTNIAQAWTTDTV